MKWKVGDIALIQCWGPSRDKVRVEGEFCTLRQYLGDRISESGDIIRNAWIVEIHDPKQLDIMLVSERALARAKHPNSKTCWSECVWQPLELTRYP